MAVIVNNLTYAPVAGPAATSLVVQEVIGSLPVAASQDGAAVVAVFTDSGSNASHQILGGDFVGAKTGGGSAVQVIGALAGATATSSTVTNLIGLETGCSANSATVSSATAIQVNALGTTGSNTITTAYGVSIAAQNATGVGQAALTTVPSGPRLTVTTR